MKNILLNRNKMIISICTVLVILIGVILCINNDNTKREKDITKTEKDNVIESASVTKTDDDNNNEQKVDGSSEESINEDATNLNVDKMVNKAVSQIGQGPDANGITVYGKWYEENVDGNDAFASAPWCAMFLSWCANEVEISKDIIGYYAECSFWKNDFYVKNGLWQDASGYTPKKGDLLFFDNHNNDKVADHNGIVEKVTATDVTVIEGNLNNKVDRATYKMNDSKILGYGTPNYSKKSTLENKKPEQSQNAQVTVPNIVSKSVSQADKIMEVASSQLGIGEDGNGCTKYGYWYSQNIDKSSYFASAPWCAMFVTWCANQAGISTDIITPYAYCGYGIQYFRDKGCYHTRMSGYVPKKGDVIFFGADTHTGLVEYSKDGYVYTIEGNSTNSTVARRSYALSYADINGYGAPKYE